MPPPPSAPPAPRPPPTAGAPPASPLRRASRHRALALTLTADTSQLGPSTSRAPRVDFAPLGERGLRSPGALARALLKRYAADALAASPALVGSLQLLGNPTVLVRSVRAGLSDALALPIEGARQGPRGFVVGLGAGASSLLQHVSHGALSSVSDFATAVATTLATRPRRRRRRGCRRHRCRRPAPSPFAPDGAKPAAVAGSDAAEEAWAESQRLLLAEPHPQPPSRSVAACSAS